MYALVLIEYSAKSIDKAFIYKIPDRLKNDIKIGMKVSVPFNNRDSIGFVINITDKCDEEFDIKEIKDIVDKDIVMNKELLDLAAYLQEQTLCTKILSFQTMLPPSLKVKSNKTNSSNYNTYDIYISLNKSKKEIKELLDNKKLGINQKKILEDLLCNEKQLRKNYSLASVKSLIDKGLIKEESIQKYRINVDNEINNDIMLTSEQQSVYDEIIKNKDENNTYLLQGVTGSGKTIIYLKLIENVIKEGKSAILLVPEISLTAQIVGRVYNYFGSKAAILHSALSNGEKHDEYLKILRGEVSIVVGTRSAIFAPLNNLGIIIIDEEHSDSYKQDNNPRYSAIDIADFRSKYNDIPLVLGSATPSLEARARADKNVFKLLTLNKRIGNAKLPTIHIVDMAKEMAKKNTIFSDLLKEKIHGALGRGEQVILLLNRRGYSTFINCSNCGHVYKCPNCDISLIYHKTTNNLICHYCGYITKKDDKCPKCGEDALNYYGLGTEKLEEYIKNTFVDAKVVRMDLDTTTTKGAHERIIKDFQDEKYNILLGTQMISKGLDFPKVSLVGVINADTSLNVPDFRSNENTFSLLYQVSGRAGRSDINGEVVIQTFNPDNFVIECVKRNDYESFYKKEMIIRRNLKYPPYYYLVGIKVIGKDYNNTLTEATKIVKYLKSNVEEETICLGPTTASVLKFNNEYRFQIIIKYRFDNSLKNILKELDNMYSLNNKTRLEIDFNPIRI